MDPAFKKRIERAWEESKDWITSFTGSPHLALLVGVPPASIIPALSELAQQSENFRVTTIPAEHLDQPQFIPLEAVPVSLAQLQEGKLSELSVNYAIRLETFDLDIHLVLHALEDQKYALELVWWSDQVFSEEADPLSQFEALASYFIHLQNLFASPNLFISPEAGKDSVGGAELWVEV
jgi:hypothetical protein